jgi:NADH-quinone oxidoreductase subunit J
MDFYFHLFAALALFTAILVISSTNPIHSVFFLILVFLNSSALLFSLQIDFLAFIILIIYVGAIAVLFLFVVMMLHLNLFTLHDNLFRYLPIGSFLAIFFLLHFFYIANTFTYIPNSLPQFIQWNQLLFINNSTYLFGNILYTHYWTYFIMCGLLLFIAMIGVIVLTFHQSIPNKKQDIHVQLSIPFQNTVYLI